MRVRVHTNGRGVVGACATVRRIDRLRSDCASKEGGVIAPWRPARVGPGSVVRGWVEHRTDTSSVARSGVSSWPRIRANAHAAAFVCTRSLKMRSTPPPRPLEKWHLTFSRLGMEPTPRLMGECWLDPSSTAGTGCVQLWAFKHSDLYESIVLSSTPVHRRLGSARGVWWAVF